MGYKYINNKIHLSRRFLLFVFRQALLKMDCQGLVARLVLDFVLLTTAVEVAARWRELAEKLARVSRQQMEAYEAPHRDKNGLLDNEVRGRNFEEIYVQSQQQNILKRLTPSFPS